MNAGKSLVVRSNTLCEKFKQRHVLIAKSRTNIGTFLPGWTRMCRLLQLRHSAMSTSTTMNFPLPFSTAAAAEAAIAATVHRRSHFWKAILFLLCF